MTTLIALAVTLLAGTLPAAEFHLHNELRTEGGLVLVKDIADVYASDPDQVKALGEIDLIAAPPDGQKRFLPLREIQDLLAIRGLNMRDHRFTGASQVKIYGIIEAKAPADRTMPQQLPVKQISDAVRQAIIGHLNKRMPEVDSWIVKLSLKEEQLKQIAPGVNSISVDGGRNPGPARKRSKCACRPRRERCGSAWRPTFRCRRRSWWPRSHSLGA